MIAVCFKPRMFANHRGQLKSVQFGHRDIDKDDSDVVPQQLLKRFSSGRSLDEILAKLSQDDFVAEKLRRLIVDQKNIHRVPARMHLPLRNLSDEAKCEEPTATVPY